MQQQYRHTGLYMFFAILASYIVIFILLAKLAWTDHKVYLLPNVYNLSLLLMYLAFHILTGWEYVSPYNALIGAVAGGGFLIILRLIANHLMQTDTIGFGDIKFVIAAGVGLGVPNIFLMLTIGSAFGILHGMILFMIEKRKTDKDIDLGTVNVPAGVGLCIATALITAYQFHGWWEGMV